MMLTENHPALRQNFGISTHSGEVFEIEFRIIYSGLRGKKHLIKGPLSFRYTEFKWDPFDRLRR